MTIRKCLTITLIASWSASAAGQARTSPELQEIPSLEDEPQREDKVRSVRGLVIDHDSGLPIPFVRVVALGTTSQTRTDNNGLFVVEGVPRGSFELVVDDPVVEPVSVLTGAGDELITLRTRYRMERQETVVVRGTLPPTPSGSQTTVTQREIKAIPMRNAEDAMRLVPGVTLVQHGSEGKGHQFFLRGFDAVHGTDLEVTLEGIPLNEWSNVHGQGYLDLGFILPETISSVEATKGPFLDGQGAFAMAGSVDYRLGIAEEDRGARASYIAGTTNRHRVIGTYSPRDDDGKDFIALEALHDESFGQNRAINRGSFLASWRLTDSPRTGTLSLLTSGYLASFELPGSIRNDDVRTRRVGFYDSYDHAGRGLSGRALLGLRYRRRLGRHDIGVTVYGGYRRLSLLENYTGFLIDSINGDRRRQSQSTVNFGVAMDDAIHLGSWMALHYGLSVHGDLLEQSQQHVGKAEESIGVERALDGAQTVSSLLGSLRLKPTESLSLTLGGRLDVVQVSAHDQTDESSSALGTLLAASPRVTASWKVFEPWNLFFSYGRGFRPPEARAFSSYEPRRSGISEELYRGGEPSMTLSDALELGTRIKASKNLEVMASGFATFIAREAVFDHVSGLNLELNGTRRLGVELDLRSRPTGWLLLEADATLVDARFVNSGNQVPFAPWLSGSLLAVLTHPSGWRAGARFFALAPRVLPHGARGAPMARLDATLGYHFEHFQLDLAVENLLNRKIRDGENHYASDWDPTDGASQIPTLHSVAGPPINARLGFAVVY